MSDNQQQQTCPKMETSEKSESEGAWQQEQEFLDYMFVNLHGSLPNNDKDKSEKDAEHERKQSETRRRSLYRTSQATHTTGRVGLEHLDNLCKLMEQLSELRDQNLRLRKRVQYLEDMKTLQEMHQELQFPETTMPKGSADSLDVDSSSRQKSYNNESRSVESLLDEPVAAKSETEDAMKKLKTKSAAHARFKKTKNRERSKSVGYDEAAAPGETETAPAETVEGKPGAQTATVRPKTKVSKWTRVKEAFRWEKAHHVETQGAKLTSKQQQGQQHNLEQQTKEAAGNSCKEHNPRKASDNDANETCHPPLCSPSPQMASKTSIASSSSSSECLLESEILKSFADARELPFYPLQPHTFTCESDANMEESDDVFLLPRRRTSNQSLGTSNSQPAASKRFHRHSTVSCEGTLGLLSSPASTPEAVTGLPEAAEPRQKPCLTISVPSEEIVEETEPLSEPKESCESKKWNRLKRALLNAHTADINRQARSVPSSPSRLETFNFDENVIHELQTAVDEDGSNRKSSIQKSPTADDFKIDKKHGDTAVSGFHDDLKKSPKMSPVSAGNLMENISPEFRKKVEEWERIKSGNCESSIDNRVNKKCTESSKQQQATDLPPEFKKKLAEWEIRKAVAGKSDQNVEELQKILPEEFNRKLQEWERIKAAGKPVSPGLERQGSASGKRGKGKGGKQRDDKTVKSGKSDVVQREKQKEKELQWLEKELQKIEREKHRLEREREKYIERETRLEKIREAMRQPQADGEICIRTSTGEFRFQGLSRKFTKKLWQWEEQKNIRPEASTIALLDPAYSKPEMAGEMTVRSSNGLSMNRSKSESSLAELVSASVHSQPSSMSLNDAEAVEYDRRLVAASSAAAQADQGLTIHGAVLVEVEDVIEEMSAITEIPEVKPEEAVYSYAPPEVTRLIDAPDSTEEECLLSGEAAEYEPGPSIRRNDSVRTECSYKLLEENLSILNRLRAKEAIFRDLETQMNDLDGHITGITSTQLHEMDRLKKQEAFLQQQQQHEEEVKMKDIEILKQRIEDLEKRGTQLKAEKEQLRVEFAKHSQQQSLLAQKLVDKMNELRQVSEVQSGDGGSLQPDLIQKLGVMTNELLEQARVLEDSLNEGQHFPAEESQDLRHFAENTSQEISQKALQLKEEFVKLKTQEAEQEPDVTESTAAEMSPADMSKIFVSTRRLLFSPVASNEDFLDPEAADESGIVPAQEAKTPEESVETSERVPWRRPPLQRQESLELQEALHFSNNSIPWRKKSTESAKIEKPPTRSTAPNIRRMIAKYHEKIAGSDTRKNTTASPPTLNISRARSSLTEVLNSPQEKPLTRENSKDSDSSIPAAVAPDPHLLQPIQLAKSQSAGVIPSAPAETVPHAVLRSGSGHALTTATKCLRNPSFFRKSPLDPSIDDILQKYQGKRYVPPACELPRSPLSHERAAKLRKAKEEFLAAALGDNPETQQNTGVTEVSILLPDQTAPNDSSRRESQDSFHQFDRSSKNCVADSERKVSQTLCRQSLFVELRMDSPQQARTSGSGCERNTAETVDSVRSCPSSPSLSHSSSKNRSSSSNRNSWLKQPKLLFFRPK